MSLRDIAAESAPPTIDDMPSDEGTPAALPGTGRRTYLVVDGDTAVLEGSVDALKSLGAGDVTSVTTGNDALDQLDGPEAQPDVILTDLNLPGMSGVDLLRSLAERGYPGDVVLVSDADDDTLDVAVGMARYRGLNVLGAISKPMTAQSLEATLNPPVAAE
jgi:CheY-like chemotaxis protein